MGVYRYRTWYEFGACIKHHACDDANCLPSSKCHHVQIYLYNFDLSYIYIYGHSVILGPFFFFFCATIKKHHIWIFILSYKQLACTHSTCRCKLTCTNLHKYEYMYLRMNILLDMHIHSQSHDFFFLNFSKAL